jgi:hypothetical protein
VSLQKKLRLPKEHGAWAMLYVPFVLGTIVAGQISLASLCLLLSVSAFFISRESLLIWWRAKRRKRDAQGTGKMMLIYLAIAALFGAPLIFFYQLFALVPLAVFGVALLVLNGKQAVNLEERSLINEILAICGLTLTAPAAYYVAGGEWTTTAWWLWALSAVYFSSSVFYIKFRVVNLHPNKPEAQRREWQHCAFYHSFLLIALVIVALTNSLELSVIIAFAPAMGRAFWSLAKPTQPVSLTRAGVLEVGYSLIFLIFVMFSFH